MNTVSLENSAVALVFTPQYIKQFNSMKKNEVESAVNMIKFIARFCIKACKAFKNSKLQKFDALVGENACQLRTSKIVDSAQKFLVDKSFQTQIDQVMEGAGRIAQMSVTPSKKKTSFEEFFREQIQTLDLGKDLQFIVQSYLLTYTKSSQQESQGSEVVDKTDAQKLIKFGLLKNKAIKIVSDIQERLARDSVIYIIEQGDELEPTEENLFVKRRAKYLRKDSNGRLCSPCFYSFDICFKRVLEKGQSIVFVIHRYDSKRKKIDTVKIHYGVKENAFEIQKDEEKFSSEAVMVIEGISVDEKNKTVTSIEFVQKFDEKGPMLIMMANAAQHSLYPSKLSHVIIPGDERLEDLAEEAGQIGCSMKNPCLFLAEHIYADTLEYAMQGEK